MQSYSRTIETSSNNLTNLLQRYLDIQQSNTPQNKLVPSLFNSNNQTQNLIHTSRSVNQSPLFTTTKILSPRRRQVHEDREI